MTGAVHAGATLLATGSDRCFRLTVKEAESVEEAHEGQYPGIYTKTVAIGNATPYATASYSYNVRDQLTDVYGPDENGDPTVHTSIVYDLAGRKTSMSDPDMGTWQYRYDAAGNLIKQRDARKRAICFYYDALSRLVGKTYHTASDLDDLTCSGNYTVSYSYDSTANGNNGVGRRTGMSDGSGSTAWVYDVRGRVTRETKTINDASGDFITRWTYDAMDRVRSITYPDNEVVHVTYTAQGLPDTLIGNHTYVANTVYDEAGRVDSRDLGQGSIDFTYYAWDQTGPWGPDPSKSTKGGALARMLVTLGSSELLDLNYFYDRMGNIEHINDWRPGLWENHDFTYDALDRMLTASANSNVYSAYSDSYAYHSNSNIQSKNGQIYGYDANHPHAVSSAPAGSYGYDANGNMTSRTLGGTTYTLAYDAENRLMSVSGGGTSASFVYDGDGNRVKATVDGVITYYVDRLYEEEAGGGYTKYYFAGGDLVAFERSSGYGQDYGRRYVFRDHLGGTAVIINGGGAKLWEDRYKAFGDVYYTYRKDQGGRLYQFSRWHCPPLAPPDASLSGGVIASLPMVGRQRRLN